MNSLAIDLYESSIYENSIDTDKKLLSDVWKSINNSKYSITKNTYSELPDSTTFCIENDETLKLSSLESNIQIFYKNVNDLFMSNPGYLITSNTNFNLNNIQENFDSRELDFDVLGIELREYSHQHNIELDDLLAKSAKHFTINSLEFSNDEYKEEDIDKIVKGDDSFFNE